MGEGEGEVEDDTRDADLESRALTVSLTTAKAGGEAGFGGKMTSSILDVLGSRCLEVPIWRVQESWSVGEEMSLLLKTSPPQKWWLKPWESVGSTTAGRQQRMQVDTRAEPC